MARAVGAALSLLLSWCAVTRGFPAESRLYRDLLSDYNKLARPITNASDVVSVSFSVTMQALELDVQQDVLRQNVWITMSWEDPRLQWDPALYADVKSIRLMPEQLWMPDIMPYNMLPASSMSWLQPTPVVVSSDGKMLHVAPSALATFCLMSDRKPWIFQHECAVKFGSWTRDGWQLDLVDLAVNTSRFVRNPRWNLIGSAMKHNMVLYECCPEPYVDVIQQVIVQDSKLPKGIDWPKTW